MDNYMCKPDNDIFDDPSVSSQSYHQRPSVHSPGHSASHQSLPDILLPTSPSSSQHPLTPQASSRYNNDLGNADTKDTYDSNNLDLSESPFHNVSCMDEWNPNSSASGECTDNSKSCSDGHISKYVDNMDCNNTERFTKEFDRLTSEDVDCNIGISEDSRENSKDGDTFSSSFNGIDVSKENVSTYQVSERNIDFPNTRQLDDLLKQNITDNVDFNGNEETGSSNNAENKDEFHCPNNYSESIIEGDLDPRSVESSKINSDNDFRKKHENCVVKDVFKVTHESKESGSANTKLGENIIDCNEVIVSTANHIDDNDNVIKNKHQATNSPVGDSLAAAPKDATGLMQAKALELFQQCDPRGRGFITRRDFLSHMEGALPGVTSRQLHVVFDSLDTQGSGRLTADSFTHGCLGWFNHVTNATSGSNNNSSNQPSTLELGHGPHTKDLESSMFSQDIDEHFNQRFNEMLCSIGGGEETKEEMAAFRRAWVRLHCEHPEVAVKVEDLITALSEDAARSRLQLKDLEETLINKNTEHAKEVTRLHEELDAEFKAQMGDLRRKIAEQTELIRADYHNQVERTKEKHFEELEKLTAGSDETFLQMLRAGPAILLASKALRDENDKLSKMLSLSQKDSNEHNNNASSAVEKESDSQSATKRYITYTELNVTRSREGKTNKHQHSSTRASSVDKENVHKRRNSSRPRKIPNLDALKVSLRKQMKLLDKINRALRDDNDEAIAAQAERDQRAREEEEEG